MTFQIKSFRELVSMTKEKLDEAMLPLRIESAKNRAQGEVIKLKEKLINLEQKINEECAKKDVDFNKAGDLMDEYELTERRLNQINRLVDSLFPKEA